jgi:hypothetical protein
MGLRYYLRLVASQDAQLHVGPVVKTLAEVEAKPEVEKNVK